MELWALCPTGPHAQHGDFALLVIARLDMAPRWALRPVGQLVRLARLKMRIFHSTGADCQENCCGTDVGFGLQKEKIIKVGPIKRNELMFMNIRDLV